VAESVETLRAELARLVSLIARANDAGNTALADALTQDASRCLIDLADLHTPVVVAETPREAIVQQQQQIQPKDDPER
jgi:hypothetical protein